MSAEHVPARLAPDLLTERQWQQQVLELAQWLGWRCFHPYTSVRSTPGWPDLAMVRSGRAIFAELKTERGKVTPAQRDWLADLGAVPGVEAYLWRPRHWEDVQCVLRAERAPDGGVWLQEAAL